MGATTKRLTVLALALAAASPAARAKDLKEIARIAVPGEKPTAFGAIFVDQKTGLGYFADKDNKSLDVFDTKTNAMTGRVGGFVGLSTGGAVSGPNGILLVNDDKELWASDGDSTIKIIDKASGKIVEIISTGGKKRAAEMAFDPKNHTVIIANPNDEPPFLTLISTLPGHRIIAKLPVAEAAESLERSAYHAPSGMFYTDVPVLRGDKTSGALAQTDAATGKIAALHKIDHCTPHSLSIVAENTIFLGCSAAEKGADIKGIELAVFDIKSGKVTGYGADLGGAGATDNDPALGQYYAASTNVPGGSAIKVIDIATQKLTQKIPTSTGAHSIAVALANHRVYLPTTAKDGPCGGCILVYAPE